MILTHRLENLGRRLLLGSTLFLLVISIFTVAMPAQALIQGVNPLSATVTAGSSTVFTVTVNSVIGGSCLTAADLADPTVSFQYNPQCHSQSGTWTSQITVSTTAGSLQAPHTISITESGLAGPAPGTFILNVSAPPTTTTTTTSTTIPATTTTTKPPPSSTSTTVPDGLTTSTTAATSNPADTLPGEDSGSSDPNVDGDSTPTNEGAIPPGDDDGGGTGGDGDGGGGLVPWIAEALPGPAGDAVSSPFVILGAIWAAITDTWFAAIPLLLLLMAFIIGRAIRNRGGLGHIPETPDGVAAK